ncbi:MAG: hypothetical protein R3F34_17880 [Planctomycetota bacterium]
MTPITARSPSTARVVEVAIVARPGPIGVITAVSTQVPFDWRVYSCALPYCVENTPVLSDAA